MSVLIDEAQKQRILQRGSGIVHESGGGACFITFEQVYREIPCESGGMPKYEDVIMAHAHLPGGGKHDREMDESGLEWLHKKHPRFVNAYEAFKAGKEQKVDGTPISQFTVLSPARIKMLESKYVFTVEQLASLTDAQLGELGMGARDLQKQAKRFLETANKVDAEMKAVKENEKLKERLAELEEKLANVDNDKPKAKAKAKAKKE